MNTLEKNESSNVENQNIDHSVVRNLEGQYLTFPLSSEEYAIGLLKVREIIRMMPITQVIDAPRFVRGVINLRGEVIPVIDLRLKFGIDAKDDNERTCIIILILQSGSETIHMGAVVDVVSEVIHVKNSQVEVSPEYGMHNASEAVSGIAKLDKRDIILLNTDKLLSVNEFDMLKQTRSE